MGTGQISFDGKGAREGSEQGAARESPCYDSKCGEQDHMMSLEVIANK